mgnify:CR=1 FL=1|jgi:hypothetical protein
MIRHVGRRTPFELREQLGEGFALDFITRVEDNLGVDVIIVPLEGSGYSLTLGGRRVIVVAAGSNWFRGAFTLAHELGHLFDPRANLSRGVDRDSAENAANAYAADLLMPREQMLSLPWSTAEDVARAVWNFGVSTHALRTRLSYLGMRVSAEADSALDMTTPSLLSAHLPTSVAVPDEVTLRSAAWAARHFPAHLLTSLRLAVEQGKAPQASLDWALGVPPQGEAEPECCERDSVDLGELDSLDLELLGELE